MPITYAIFEEVFDARRRLRRRTVEPGYALILYRSGQATIIKWPEQPAQSGWARWKRYDRAFRVDLRPFRSEWWLTAPTKDRVFRFEAEVRGLCKVVDPARVVTDGTRDPAELFKQVVGQRVCAKSREFEVDQTADAEMAIASAFQEAPLQEGGFELCDVDVQLRLDKEARRHVGDLRRLQYENQRALESARLNATLQEQERDALRSSVDFYYQLIDRGASSIWAIQLARDPRTIPELIARIHHQDDNKQTLLRGLFDTILSKSDIEERDVRDDLLVLWRSIVRGFEGPGRENPPDGIITGTTALGGGEEAPTPPDGTKPNTEDPPNKAPAPE